jgi:hypothetical protein
MKIRTMLIGLLLACVAQSATAAITVVAQYRLGDNDPGAAAGQPGAAQTLPAIGNQPLDRFGNPSYSDATPPRGDISRLSMNFDGSTARYMGPVLTTATNNVGIEAWVRSNGRVTNNATIAYNGNTATSGFGVFRIGGSWAYLIGGVVLGGTVPVTTEWTHLAFVRDNGVGTLYVNGVAAATTTATPNAPAGNFLVGGNPLVATEWFDGLIDEVRLFTFNPGAFLVSDLNFYERPAAPVPAHRPSLLIGLALALALVGLLALARR